MTKVSTTKFKIGDLSTNKKIEESFSNLFDHINGQDIPKENREALTTMANGFHARFSMKSDLAFNAAMLNQAALQVNNYL